MSSTMPSAPIDDYYAMLGVDVGADNEELRKAWRRLAMQWHPDRAGAEATATFQRLASAYAVLSDPIARAAHAGVDARPGSWNVASGRGTGAVASGGGRVALRRDDEHTAADHATGRAISDAVAAQRAAHALLACGAARHEEPGYITLVLRSDEAARGGMATISMQVDVKCPQCAGRGCERCGGKGRVRELFSAWLAVPPGVTTGEVLAPSVELPGTATRVGPTIHVTPKFIESCSRFSVLLWSSAFCHERRAHP